MTSELINDLDNQGIFKGDTNVSLPAELKDDNGIIAVPTSKSVFVALFADIVNNASFKLDSEKETFSFDGKDYRFATSTNKSVYKVPVMKDGKRILQVRVKSWTRWTALQVGVAIEGTNLSIRSLGLSMRNETGEYSIYLGLSAEKTEAEAEAPVSESDEVTI